MSPNVLMAWCPSERYENTLAQHLLDTAVVAVRIRRIRGMISALASRLSMMELAGEEEVSSLVLSSLLLHDIGKGCSKYQESIKKKGGKCGASFPYHEVVSAIILANAILENPRLRALLGGDRTAPVIVYVALSHHQAMKERAIETLQEDKTKLASKVASKSEKLLIREILCTLDELSNKLPKALSNYVTNEVITRVKEIIGEVKSAIHDLNIYRETLMLYLSLAEREGGYRLIRDFIDNYDPRVWQLAYSTSGVVMISDSLAAAAERSEEVRGLTRSLLRELKISIKDLDRILREIHG